MRPISRMSVWWLRIKGGRPLIETAVVRLLSPFCVSLTTLWTVCQSSVLANARLGVRGMPGDHVKSMFYSSPQCLRHWDGATEICCGGMGIELASMSAYPFKSVTDEKYCRPGQECTWLLYQKAAAICRLHVFFFFSPRLCLFYSAVFVADKVN